MAPADEPIAALMRQVADEFEPFALANPGPVNRDLLLRTLRLLDWYHKHNRYAEALILAKEWCISWLMFKDGVPSADIVNRDKRDAFARVVGSRLEVSEFWSSLAGYRNRLAHAEMVYNVNTRQTKIERLQRDIDSVLTKVVKLRQLI